MDSDIWEKYRNYEICARKDRVIVRPWDFAWVGFICVLGDEIFIDLPSRYRNSEEAIAAGKEQIDELLKVSNYA